MRRKQRFAARAWMSALVLPLVAAACAETKSLEENTALGEEAVVACDASQVTWANPQLATNVCSGAWKYQRYGSCPLSRPACGAPSVCANNHWKTCADWSFGPTKQKFGGVTYQSNPYGPYLDPVPTQTHTECDPAYCPAGTCCKVTEPNTASALATCTARMNAEITAQKASIPAAYQSLVHAAVGSPAVTIARVGNTYRSSCTYTLLVPTPATAAGAVCGCADPLVPPTCVVSDPACGPDGVDRFSPEGISLQGLVAYDPKVVGSTIACSTCEGLPLPASGTEDPAVAQAKYACLAASSSVVPATSRPFVDRQKALVYELVGDQLTASQRADAASVYTSDPTAIDALCAAPTLGLSFPTACSPFRTHVTPLFDELERCVRLLDAHVPTAVASLEQVGCAALVDKINAEAQLAPAGCDLGPLRELARTTMNDLLTKQLEVVKTKPNDLGTAARQLYLLDRTLTSDRAALGTPAHAALLTGDGDLSRATGALWAKLYEREGVVQNVAAALANNADVSAATTQAADKSDAVSRELLTAALTKVSTLDDTAHDEHLALNGPPARSRVLLSIVGDATAPLGARLHDLSVFQDFGCLFRACRAPAGPTPIVQMYRLLATSQSSASFATALASAGPLGGYRDALAHLGDPLVRAAFDAAIVEAAGTNDLTAVDAATLPPWASGFASIVRDARARDAAFTATGFLDPKPKVLDSGADLAATDAVVAALTLKRNQLDASANANASGLTAFLQELHLDLGATAQAERLELERQQNAAVHDDLANDLSALQSLGAAEDVRFASFVDTFASMEGALDQGELLQVGSSTTLSMSGHDSKYTTGPVNLTALGVGAPIALSAGQILTISVNGQWAPTCAIRAASVLGPPPASGAQGATSIAVAGATTGPEGYSVVLSNGGFQAVSSSNSTTETQTVTVGANGEACLKGSIIGLEARACAYVDASKSTQWSGSIAASSGEEQRWSASFATGLRLPTTPFPDLPVGALLAVVKSNNAIKDVYVVREPSTEIFADQDATVTFVVNDIACASQDSANTLTVSARPLTSVGAASSAITSAMGSVLTALRAQRVALSGQGRLLPSQSQQLHSDALAALQTQLAQRGLSIGQLPAPLMTLFSAFVDHEVVGIERAIEITSLDRQLLQARLRLAGIDVDVAAGGEQAKVRQVLLAQVLRNVDAERLRGDTAELAAKTRDYLLPLLELWYPGHVPSKSAALAPFLNTLTTLADINTNALPLADATVGVVDTLLQGFGNAAFGNKPAGSVLPVVAVSFPRPGQVANPFNPPFESLWHTADAVRSQMVWDAIDQRQLAPITITPEDIYTLGSGAGTLSCKERTPVVKRVMFYFGSASGFSDEASLNALNRWIGATASESQSFLTEAGPLTLSLAPESSYRGFEGSVTYGPSFNAVQSMRGSPNFTRPVGLSPFGTSLVDFRNVDANWPGPLHLDDASELVVVMEIDSKAVASSQIPGVARCP